MGLFRVTSLAVVEKWDLLKFSSFFPVRNYQVQTNYSMERGGCSQNVKRMKVLVAPRAPAMEAHERTDDTTFSSSLCIKLLLPFPLPESPISTYRASKYCKIIP